jgi:hypothetical protein
LGRGKSLESMGVIGRTFGARPCDRKSGRA